MTRLAQRLFTIFILINLFLPQFAFANTTAVPISVGNGNCPNCIADNISLHDSSGKVEQGDIKSNRPDMDVYYEYGQIRIESPQGTDRATIGFNKNALENLKGYNGKTVGITHIADDGKIIHYVDKLELGNNSFAHGTYNFSTIIISGLTGTTTFSETGLSGNYTKSFNEVNVSYIDFNITNHQSTADAYGNDLYIEFSPNELMISGSNPDLPLQAYFDISSGVAANGANVRVYYQNGTEIPREIESYSNNNLSMFFKPDTTDNTTNITYRLWYGNTSAPEPASDSIYGSEAVWDGTYVAVWHMNNDPAGSPVGSGVLLDSTSNANDGDSYGTMTSGDFIDGDYGKGINFDGIDDYFRIPYSSEFQTSTWGIMARLKRIGDSGTHQNVLSRGHHLDIDEYRNYQMYIVETTWLISQVFESLGGADEGAISGGEIAQGIIEFVESKYDGSNSRVLDSGVEVGIIAETAIPDTTTADLMIGEYVRGSGVEYGWEFLGDMYEVRLSNIARSDNYSLTTYKNLNNPTATGIGAFYKSIGIPQQISLSVNITTSVIGDTNTINYTTDIPQIHTLIPSANISEIMFNTTSTDWDYIAILYWTNDVILSEIASNGEYHANITAIVPLNLNNGMINYTITNTILLNADFSNFIQLSTNDSNYNETLSNLTLPDISIYTTATTGTYYYDLQYDYFYPPQNLTAVPDITHIYLNWTATPNADKYTIYELEEGIPWFDTSPTLDGIIDSIYNTTSHHFHIFSPNSVNSNDFDYFYMGRDAVWVYLAGTAIDNDANTLDDYARLYIDFAQDGLTTDDRMYEIRENAAVKRYAWSGSSWAISPGSGVGGATTGAGTNLITYEMRVPVSELPVTWLTGLETKMLLERECTSLQPDIYSYYPFGNINATDVSIWQDIKLTNASEYEWIANTTNIEYNASGIIPFNWYQYAVSAWNQTDETSYSLVNVTTLDYPTYTISGYILDNSTGLGISDAQVWATNGFVSARETTNATGYYGHGGFHNGTYIIYADADGYDQNNTTAFTISGANITNKNVILEVTIVPPPLVTTHLLFPIFLIMVILTLVLTAYSFIIKDPDYYTHIISSTTVSILYFILGYNAYHGIGFTDVVDTATFVNGTITSSVETVIITTYAYSWLAMLFIIAGAIMALYALVNAIEEGKAIVEDRRNDY